MAIKQYLRIKGLDLIDSATPQDFDEWRGQVDEWTGSSQTMAVNAIDSIESSDYDLYAVVDDATERLQAIAAYKVYGNGVKDGVFPKTFDGLVDEYIHLSYIASLGGGAGKLIMEDLKEVSSSSGMPLVLNALEDDLDSYYIGKIGMEKNPEDNNILYWIPPEIKKQRE